MARSSAIYYQAYNSTAVYKAWAQTISNALNQVATRTNDTGQVNWATIPNESQGVVRDYEVFALGGPLQATAPVFMRFDYTGGYLGNVSVTVGTTTDGAGNLGGLLVPKLALQGNTLPANASTIPQWMWASADNDSYLTLVYALDVNAIGPDSVGILVVERTRALSGAASGAGFHVWRWNFPDNISTLYSGGWSKTFGATSQPAAVNWGFDVLMPDLGQVNSGYVGGSSYAFPVYTYTPPFPKGASKALLLGHRNDWPRGQPVALTHYGESMTFIPMADCVTVTLPYMANANASATKTTISPLIRWD